MLGTRSDFCIRSRKWSSASQWGRAYFTSITSALSCYQGLNLTYTVTNRVQWPWSQSKRCIAKQYPTEDTARNNFMHFKPNYILECYFRSEVCQLFKVFTWQYTTGRLPQRKDWLTLNLTSSTSQKQRRSKSFIMFSYLSELGFGLARRQVQSLLGLSEPCMVSFLLF